MSKFADIHIDPAIVKRAARGDAKAHEIIAFMEGAQIQRFLDPANLRLVALYESYTAALVRDLAASPAAADRALGRVQ